MHSNLQVDSAYAFVLGCRAMLRRMLKSKIHRATVTDARVHYEGSITIDEALMEAADIREYEEVHVWDVTNGARLITYAIKGAAGSGAVAMNGAAALLITKGDVVIIGNFADMDEAEVSSHKPRCIYVDAKNRIVRRHKGEEC